MPPSSLQHIELLAPAGNFEKLEIAIHYGADAVYLAGKDFSLRNFSGNFTLEEMQAAIRFAHHQGVKVYVACNIYSRNFEQEALTGYLKSLKQVRPDAIIIADPGILLQARRIIPEIDIHLSTQVNTTNYNSVLFWENFGIKRINTARELSLDEIKEIGKHCSAEIEAFVHGAMCISYSGRCLLSSFMINRDSNRGLCAHPCRWRYSVVEEMRPGQYHPVAEDDRGSYIFNSKDLCMIEHIPDLIQAGISSLKIEGRMKGINYLASTVKAYREAIDSYFENPARYRIKTEWLEDLGGISHRGYCTGFYFGDPTQTLPNLDAHKTGTLHLFVGKITKPKGACRFELNVRNKIHRGDRIEILNRKGPAVKDTINDIIDSQGQSIPFAQPNSIVDVVLNNDHDVNDLVRKIERYATAPFPANDI